MDTTTTTPMVTVTQVDKVICTLCPPNTVIDPQSRHEHYTRLED